MAESIFPQIPTVETTQVSLPDLGKELAFDFTVGEFVMENGKPKVVEGVDAVKVWVEKALRTARYRYLAYSHAYGCETDALIGAKPPLPTAVLTSEVQRIIKDALIYDDRIADLVDFRVEREADRLSIQFEVVTIWGRRYLQQGVEWYV